MGLCFSAFGASTFSCDHSLDGFLDLLTSKKACCTSVVDVKHWAGHRTFHGELEYVSEKPQLLVRCSNDTERQRLKRQSEIHILTRLKETGAYLRAISCMMPPIPIHRKRHSCLAEHEPASALIPIQFGCETLTGTRYLTAIKVNPRQIPRKNFEETETMSQESLRNASIF